MADISTPDSPRPAPGHSLRQSDVAAFHASPSIFERFAAIEQTSLVDAVQQAAAARALRGLGGSFSTVTGTSVFWVREDDDEMPLRIVAVAPRPNASAHRLGGPELHALIVMLLQLGCDDVSWSESLRPPTNPEAFVLELVFVIVNSGMRFTVARGIHTRVRAALLAGESARVAFGHAGKVRAIDDLWSNRAIYFRLYGRAADKLAFLGNLSWIGPITKYHAAKNFGLEYPKPDLHLTNLGNALRESPFGLCKRLADESRLRVGTIDSVLWRASAVHILDSRTARIHPERMEEAALILAREAAAF